MLKTVLLSTAALALLATAADARPQVTLSRDNRFVSVMPSKDAQRLPMNLPKKAKYLYSTLAKNSEGTYFCCYGSTISGPSSFFGAAYGVAEQFVAPKAKSITWLYAGVGYVSGSKNVTLTLYADNGSNSPGTMLAQGTGASSTAFGSCCGIVSAAISSTSLTAGTPYWVGITAGGADFDAAGFQVSDEVDNDVYVAGTSNGGTSWGAGVSETEYNPAIAVN
jgi:hypothetical protein